MDEMEETEGVNVIDNFCLHSGDKQPSLMEVPFANGKLSWEISSSGGIQLQGTCNRVYSVSDEIDMWRLELPSEGKPRILVHLVTGAWMELRKPKSIYMETMKMVLVAAHFLSFAKQSPNASKGDVWRHLRKECGQFKAKPHQKDLIQAFLLCRTVVASDPRLQQSPIIHQFYPSLSTTRRPQVAQGSGETKQWPHVECSPVAEAPILSNGSVEVVPSSTQSTPKTHIPAEHEATPPVVETLRGNTSSQSTPKTHTPVICEASPPVDMSRGEKKRKPGKPGTRRNSRRIRKGSDKDNGAKDGDWIYEPDVCAFCDDGVEKGDKLLCCDGPCMRSFHPTLHSGKQNRCPTLGLSRSAFSVETWMCPNCEAGQHQCFACGTLGNSSTSTDSQEVFVCGAKQCNRFYHPVCVAKILVPDHLVPKPLLAEQKDLANRIQSKLESFICPLHNCESCNVDEDKTDPSLCLVKCRRCPRAWHEKCLPEECRSQLWHLEGGRHVMYCGRHRLDPELLTPKRDHIKFPALNPVVNPDPGGGRHHRTEYQTARDIISKSSRAVTVESVKKNIGIFSNT